MLPALLGGGKAALDIVGMLAKPTQERQRIEDKYTTESVASARDARALGMEGADRQQALAGQMAQQQANRAMTAGLGASLAAGQGGGVNAISAAAKNVKNNQYADAMMQGNAQAAMMRNQAQNQFTGDMRAAAEQITYEDDIKENGLGNFANALSSGLFNSMGEGQASALNFLYAAQGKNDPSARLKAAMGG